RCGVKIPESGLTTVEPVECSSCGYLFRFHKRAPSTHLGQDFEIVRNYFSDIFQIMTRPSSFFQHMPLRGGLSRPLGFALVTHWLGRSIEYLWHLLIGGSLFQYLQTWFVPEDFIDVDHPGRNMQLLQL